MSIRYEGQPSELLVLSRRALAPNSESSLKLSVSSGHALSVAVVALALSSALNATSPSLPPTQTLLCSRAPLTGSHFLVSFSHLLPAFSYNRTCPLSHFIFSLALIKI